MRKLSARASVVLAGFVPLVLPACQRETRKPNVLLITIDTLRADRISALGFPRATTPNLDRLAAEGLIYTHAETPRAKTTPAVATLMTGLYPHEHGARDLLMPLEGSVPLLAERLRDAGWRTNAIVGNYVLKDEFSGLARGFDSWCEDLPQTQGVPPDDVPQRTARSLTDGALEVLARSDPQEPWFTWLHYMDPHGLYDPPVEHRVFHRDVPDPLPDEGGIVAAYNVPESCRLPDGRIDAAFVRDLYDGEVRYVDAEIGRLLDLLRASGDLEHTIVIVTADHGESLGEHRYFFEHGRDAYEACCRVPLILRMPNASERGVRDADFSLADVAPALLDLLGLPRLGSGSPRHFADASPHPVFAEKVDRTDRAGAVQIKAVRIGDWKLLARFARKAGETPPVVLSEEIYDLAHDPGETHDLSTNPPAAAPLGTLRTELAAFAAKDARFAELDLALQKRREEIERRSSEATRILRALGY